ncbi:hypothetical protein [Umezawaea sp. Da 62-37]|uniref:hypothetical protein n=1 Tax=Umezawaea sp. Da 62-37 TaxID=3075927 RepID=UPI0028F712DE|nr:hypothetical protein [Umezawaea sp. Da 62-37]WNV83090.1 hypothetical protein RM788_33540 [Umezawaea sp. Da 62-37]
MLAYLRKHVNEVPADIAQDDVLDGLVLRVRLWWEGEDHDRWLIERAERLGMNRRTTAAILNIGTSQGLVDRLHADRRKLERLHGPNQHIINTELKSDNDDAEQHWVRAHRSAVRSVVDTFLAHRHLATDEAADWLIELARDNDQPPDRTFIAILRIAAAELAESPQVKALSDGHPLQVELDRWAILSAAHRQLSAPARSESQVTDTRLA